MDEKSSSAPTVSKRSNIYTLKIEEQCGNGQIIAKCSSKEPYNIQNRSEVRMKLEFNLGPVTGHDQ